MNKITYVRVRAWAVIVVLLIAIVFYFLVTITFNKEINLIHLIFMATISIVIHFAFFPEGENYAKTLTPFADNKLAYNNKALEVNEKKAVKELREYCEIEYQERKNRYIDIECGAIGIDRTELDHFKTLSPKEISKLSQYELNGKFIYFTKQTRKRLYKLIYGGIPVERNDANSILSACETDYVKAIKDGTKTYKTITHGGKILWATLVSLFFAFIGYTFKDGITLETIAMVCFYIVTMIVTAIFSYGSGEKGITVYKNKYYIELALYLDSFFEWLTERPL